jgi:hypothetical protein
MRLIPAGCAPVDIDMEQRTESGLVVSTEPAALLTGPYWHHLKPELPVAEAMDVAFQDELVAAFKNLPICYGPCPKWS